MKKYCPDCGKQNQIGANFCCFCGNSMTLADKGRSKASVHVDGHDDEDEDEGLPSALSASKLDVEIMHYQPQKETLGSIIGSSGEPAFIDEAREGGPQVSSEEFIKEFKREAGPLQRGHEKES